MKACWHGDCLKLRLFSDREEDPSGSVWFLTGAIHGTGFGGRAVRHWEARGTSVDHHRGQGAALAVIANPFFFWRPFQYEMLASGQAHRESSRVCVLFGFERKRMVAAVYIEAWKRVSPGRGSGGPTCVTGRAPWRPKWREVSCVRIYPGAEAVGTRAGNQKMPARAGAMLGGRLTGANDPGSSCTSRIRWRNRFFFPI